MTIEAAPVAPSAPASADAPASQSQAPEAPQAKPESDPGEWAQRFATLQRQQRKLVQEQQAFKRQQDEYQAKIQAYNAYEEAKKNARTNPHALLESLGLTYKDLTDYYLNDTKPTTEQELRLLKEQIDADRKAREDEKTAQEAARHEAVIDGFKAQIQSHVREKSDSYELIGVTPGGDDLVLQVIEEHWNQSGELLDLDVACQHVEDYLTEQAKPILSLRKFAPPPKVEQPDDKAAQRQQEPVAPSFTLTNQGTAAPATTRSSYLSDEESKRQAAALIRWN